jgi:uncharacterized protein (TIGR01619 family)
MAQDWKFYLCKVNDQVASIAFDVALYADAPMAAKPWLLWVWVYLRSPRPDGLSDGVELTSISAIEGALAASIGSAFEAVEAGRITTDGRREFYFYGAHDRDFDSLVRKAMGQFGEYRFELGQRKDADWDHYFNVLFPSDEEFEKIKNRDVLEVLKSHGDTLIPVRDVRHMLYFRTTEDRKWFAEKAKELGYEICLEDEVKQDEGNSFPFMLSICRDQGITQEQIDDAVIELFRLAQQVSAEYDGWEAQLVATKH